MKEATVDSVGTTITSSDYAFDAANRRTRVVDEEATRVTYTYDAADQLLTEHRDGPLVSSDYLLTTYTYDPAGNRETRDQTEGLAAAEVTTYTYDSGNRLLHEEVPAGRSTYTYDADGNQTSKETPSLAVTTFSWDYENQSAGLERPNGDVVTHVYGIVNRKGDRLRVETDDDGDVTRLVYDGRNVSRELDELGTLEREFTYQPQAYGNLISDHANLETNFYGFDGRGNTKSVFDSFAVVTERFDYDAYGRETSHNVTGGGTGDTQNGFGGEYGYRYDRKDQKINARHRDYNPGNGLFQSTDPKAGRELDYYRYVANDPVNVIDPSGLDHLKLIPESGKLDQVVWQFGRTRSCSMRRQYIDRRSADGRTLHVSNTYCKKYNWDRTACGCKLDYQKFAVLVNQAQTHKSLNDSILCDLIANKTSTSSFAKERSIRSKLLMFIDEACSGTLAIQEEEKDETPREAFCRSIKEDVQEAAEVVVDITCSTINLATGKDYCAQVEELTGGASVLIDNWDEPLKEMFNRFMEGGKLGFDRFVGNITQNFLDGLGEWLGLPSELFTLDIRNFDVSKFLGILADMFDLNMEGLIGAVREALGDDLFGVIMKIFEEVKAASSGIGKWLSEKYNQVVSQITNLMDNIGGIITGLVTGIVTRTVLRFVREGIEKIIALLIPGAGILLQVYDFVVWFFTKGLDLIQKVFGYFKAFWDLAVGGDGVEKIADTVESTLKGAISLLLDVTVSLTGVTNIPGLIGAAIDNVKDRIWAPVKKILSALAKPIKKVWKTILQKLGLSNVDPIVPPDEWADGKHDVWYDAKKKKLLFASATPRELLPFLRHLLKTRRANATKQKACLNNAITKATLAAARGDAYMKASDQVKDDKTLDKAFQLEKQYNAAQGELGDALEKCDLNRATILCGIAATDTEPEHIGWQTVTLDSGQSFQRSKGMRAIITPDSIPAPGNRNDFDRGATSPAWWQLLPSANAETTTRTRWERGHLVGSQLGGDGGDSWENMVPLYQQANAPVMSKCESAVRKAVECGQCVILEVIPDYKDSVHPLVPGSLRFWAEGDQGFNLDVTIPNTTSKKHVCSDSGSCS